MYPHPGQGAPPQLSPDGRWWWDGQRWMPARPGSAPRQGGMGTGARVLIVATVAGGLLVLLVGVVVAAVLLAPGLGGRSALVSRPTAVVFDDDFSTDRGWDVSLADGFTTDLHLGHPGAMHMAVPAADATFHELYPGASYARARFTATIANKTGDGDVGLICDDPNTSGRYRLWAGSAGTAYIDFSRGPGTAPTILAQVDVSRWAPGETHTLTAVCSSDGTNVSLQLLIDGKSVLQASDGTTKGPFQAGVLVQGPVELDLRRFTVSTL